MLNIFKNTGLGIFLWLLGALSSPAAADDNVIHNQKAGKWGKTPPVSLQLIRTIGDVNTMDEHFAFHQPADLVVNPGENMYILDSGNHRIQLFSPDAEYLKTIGREGQGPGELYNPASLDLGPEGFIFVSDPNNNRIQILTIEGQEKKTIRMTEERPADIRVLSSGKIVMGGGGPFLSLQEIEGEEKKEQPPLMKILDQDGTILKTFAQPRDYGHMLINSTANQVSFTVDKQDNIYLTYPYQNRIEKYDPEGNLLWKADRDLNYSMDPPKNKGKIERSGGGISVQMPRMNQCSKGIAVDGEGRIWVVTLDRQIKEEERISKAISMTRSSGKQSMRTEVRGNTELLKTDMFKLEIFSSTGELLGSLPLGHFVDEIYIYGDRMFLLDQDRKAGYYEYKIVTK
jgi:hypothetical protein